MTDVVITGCYRSGTTLVQKALDVHSQATIMNHGVFGFFQMMKPALLTAAGMYGTDMPLGFRWFETNAKLIRLFSDVGFSAQLIRELLKRVEEEIGNDQMRAGNISHPTMEWYSQLRDNLVPGNAGDVLKQQFSLIGRYRNMSGARVAGFKELNLEQFAPAVLSDNPERRLIHIVRDPRAIVASRNFSESFLSTRGAGLKHPLRLITAVWRTSVLYRRSLAVEFPDAFRSISYESLVRDPEEVLGQLAEFVGIDFEPRMLDVGSFRNEAGKAWKPNSSFATPIGFDSRAAERWRDVLPDEVNAVVEYLCGDLLVEEGYEVVFNAAEQRRSFELYQEDPAELAPWTLQPMLELHG